MKRSARGGATSGTPIARKEIELAGRGPAALERTTRSEAETEALGEALGRAAFPGAVLLLEGPLGAGKTVLVRGVARGLAVAGRVTSPTFTLLDVHEGRLPLFHVDLYRVETPAELRSIDLDEVFAAGGVTAVEWPRWLLDSPPAGSLRIDLEPAPDGRRLRLSALDPRWPAALLAA